MWAASQGWGVPRNIVPQAQPPPRTFSHQPERVKARHFQMFDGIRWHTVDRRGRIVPHQVVQSYENRIQAHLRATELKRGELVRKVREKISQEIIDNIIDHYILSFPKRSITDDSDDVRSPNVAIIISDPMTSETHAINANDFLAALYLAADHTIDPIFALTQLELPSIRMQASDLDEMMVPGMARAIAKYCPLTTPARFSNMVVPILPVCFQTDLTNYLHRIHLTINLWDIGRNWYRRDMGPTPRKNEAELCSAQDNIHRLKELTGLENLKHVHIQVIENWFDRPQPYLQRRHAYDPGTYTMLRDQLVLLVAGMRRLVQDDKAKDEEVKAKDKETEKQKVDKVSFSFIHGEILPTYRYWMRGEAKPWKGIEHPLIGAEDGEIVDAAMEREGAKVIIHQEYEDDKEEMKGLVEAMAGIDISECEFSTNFMSHYPFGWFN